MCSLIVEGVCLVTYDEVWSLFPWYGLAFGVLLLITVFSGD